MGSDKGEVLALARLRSSDGTPGRGFWALPASMLKAARGARLWGCLTLGPEGDTFQVAGAMRDKYRLIVS